VLADTAGRLPTQLHLMEEIAKVRRVIQKADPTGPHETLLVLDANIGQNALMQVKAFDKAITSPACRDQARRHRQGRRVAAIARQCPKPIRFIGVGEGIDDLRPFVPRATSWTRCSNDRHVRSAPSPSAIPAGSTALGT
jgi:fused signal recognition particle receptor